MLMQICKDAGVPKGVVNVVPCSRTKVEAVGEMLCTHRKVTIVSFTGSTATGKVILIYISGYFTIPMSI